MDEIANFNKNRWNELARSNVAFSRPRLDLDPASARELVDAQGLVGELQGKQVLCLASGGGQQSAAFGILGAQVTVVDLADTQLERDREAAEHFGLDIRTIQGDMRDLGALESGFFDLVWQSYSINFVPGIEQVLDEVKRVLRPNGLYMLEFANPFTFMSVNEGSWDGSSYRLEVPYIDGQEVTELFPDGGIWDVEQSPGEWIKVQGPKEFRHNLGTVMTGLAQRQFVILGLWEHIEGDLAAKPGSWEHYIAFAPPWMKVWARLQPDVF
jgi:SAM-dependent methyltransferase